MHSIKQATDGFADIKLYHYSWMLCRTPRLLYVWIVLKVCVMCALLWKCLQLAVNEYQHYPLLVKQRFVSQLSTPIPIILEVRFT